MQGLQVPCNQITGCSLYKCCIMDHSGSRATTCRLHSCTQARCGPTTPFVHLRSIQMASFMLPRGQT